MHLSLSDDVPDSNPDETNRLWARVCHISAMSDRTSRTSGRGRRRGAKEAVGETGSTVSGSTSALEAEESGDHVRNQPVKRKGHSNNASRSNFAKVVLNSRGIFVNNTSSIVPSAFAHFGTKKPQDNYSHLDGLRSANVWVEKDDAEEFATLAKETFLLRGWRSIEVSPDRLWRAERMLQLVCPPEENAHCRIPPILDISAVSDAEWRWDIRPDCAYWLSLKGFNPRYRFQIQNCTFVRDYITCPYFTIEFKRDGQSEDVAVRQVAAAGSLALFNRWYLHSEARKARPSLAENLSNLRHYALTYVDSKFVFWVLRPTLNDGTWEGCTMTRLIGADCADEYGVRELIDWINEVHRWGILEHGPGCERDIKAVLNSGGVRTSDIHEDSPNAT
ncbi:hypothetical protein GE09DRAFT_1256523 [Coniochaeta sp. 2T2.1]|nr:hypothetical protein GE09DRAFT_1256523 [Coniochaeta sp. 2T2.1]